MNKWLQRTVGVASCACGIVLAASGIASAGDEQPVAVGDPLGAVGSVQSLAGSAVPDAQAPGSGAGEAEKTHGMSSDLLGSKLLGSGAVGGTSGDVTRPAEDLPLLGRLPAVGQLGSAVPLGSTPLGVD
ncbi:MAG: hypothetical protein ACRD0P_20980, partial [Stackebrandtia sp.]